MNWLDWAILTLIAAGAVRGFFRGFVVELATLVAVVVGLWAAVHYNVRVAGWVGMDTDNEAFSFLITFLLVLLVIILLGKVATKAMDLAMLGLPNKVAGLFFGALRTAFILSVVLNLLMASSWFSARVPPETLRRSKLVRPVRAFAPLIVPALGESRWLHEAVDRLREAGVQV